MSDKPSLWGWFSIHFSIHIFMIPWRFKLTTHPAQSACLLQKTLQNNCYLLHQSEEYTWIHHVYPYWSQWMCLYLIWLKLPPVRPLLKHKLKHIKRFQVIKVELVDNDTKYISKHPKIFKRSCQNSHSSWNNLSKLLSWLIDVWCWKCWEFVTFYCAIPGREY